MAAGHSSPRDAIGFATGSVVAMTLVWLNLEDNTRRLAFIGAGLAVAWAGGEYWKRAARRPRSLSWHASGLVDGIVVQRCGGPMFHVATRQAASPTQQLVWRSSH